MGCKALPKRHQRRTKNTWFQKLDIGAFRAVLIASDVSLASWLQCLLSGLTKEENENELIQTKKKKGANPVQKQGYKASLW